MLTFGITSKEITILQLVVGSLIVIFSLINIGIYLKQKKRFSIKYDLLRDPSFRGNKSLMNLIYVFYYSELCMPILLMIILFLEVVIRDATSGFMVLINGMLLISLIYLTNPSTFYIKIAIILILLSAAQLMTLYLSKKTPDILYSASSAIFFSLNGILVSLAIYANQNVYWDLSEIINVESVKEKLQKVNSDWATKIPKIVDGGVYGWFNKKRAQAAVHQNQDKSKIYLSKSAEEKSQTPMTDVVAGEREPEEDNCCANCCGKSCRGNQSLWFIILYCSSLATLILYAFQDWWFSKGWIGTISSGAILTFDLVIFVLSSFSSKMRSPFTLMLIVFTIRFFLFVFGNASWFMGYCILYILIGTFIASLIIQKRFPKTKVQQKQEIINALRTPQFLFILITAEFVIMIVSLFFSNNRDVGSDTLIINGHSFQFWSVGVISLFVTFIFAIYLTTIRVLYRSLNKIQDRVVYYFFDKSFTEYHMYLLVTYSLIVALGAYTYVKYSTSLSLALCLFLPFVYLTLVALGVSWQKNSYQILSQTKRNINNRSGDEQSSSHEMVQNPGDLQDQVSRVRPEENTSCLQYLTSMSYQTKKILSAFVFLLVTLAAMTVTSYLWCKSPVGLYVSICVLSYLTQFSYVRCIKTAHSLTVAELIVIILGYLLGIIFWGVNWSEIGGCLTWSTIFILILSYLLVQSFKTKEEEKVYVTQIVQILLLMTFDVVVIYLQYKETFYVVIVCGLMFYFIMGLTFYYFFISYNKALPKWVYYLIAGIIGATFIAIILATFFMQSVSIFTTFSIAMLLPIAGVVAFGWSQFYYRHLRRFDDIVVNSAYGLPSMRFISEKEVLKSDEYYLYLYFIALMGLVVYGEITFLFFDDHINAGIYSLCCFEVVGFLSLSLIVIKNYYEIGKNKTEITSEMLEETLTTLLEKYMPDIDDDKNTGEKRRELKELEEYVESHPEAGDVNQKYDEIVHLHDAILINEQEEENFLFFWMALIEFRIVSKAKETMLGMIHTWSEIKEELASVQIVFEDDAENDDFEVRYQKIQNQVNALDAIRQLEYQRILKEHQEAKLKEIEAEKRQSGEDNKKNMDREKALYQKILESTEVEGEKNGKIKQGYAKTAEDEKIIKEFIKKAKECKERGESDPFIDDEFDANSNSLGDKVKNKVKGWQRPGANCSVIKNNVEPKDIKQGKLGDCYLISTLGVLGERIVKKAMGLPYINNKGEQVGQKWPSDPAQGIFMVRFKKFRKNVFVKVDSRFPVGNDGQWVLGRCEDQDQIWVNILEKAYAKMYSSYTSIVGGKAHFVMAEFTGGFPSEIILETYHHNANALWNKLESYQKNKYIMAAGSVVGSDNTYTPLGIARGHAYAILEIKAVDSHRLIKMKNPQGNNSKEWKGDFSDDSPQMNDRMKSLLNHESAADGIFWMPLTNFLTEFKSLYICREFDDQWQKHCADGEWKANYSSFGNQKMKDIQYNPQFGITITKKATVFISVTQERGTDNTSSGKIKMGFRLQRNSGKRLYHENISSVALCTPSVGATGNLTLTNQYQLEENTYPYTYTLMVYPYNEGGEGKFLVEVYCNDEKWSLQKDEEFDSIQRPSPS